MGFGPFLSGDGALRWFDYEQSADTYFSQYRTLDFNHISDFLIILI